MAVPGPFTSAPYQGNTEVGEGSAPPAFAGLLLRDLPLEETHDKLLQCL